MVRNLAVQIVRFADESFPGWLACEFVDCEGVRHTIVDKWPHIADEMLDEKSAYPCLGHVVCEVLSQFKHDQEGELVRISIANPVAMESTEGLSEFTVLASQLSEYR